MMAYTHPRNGASALHSGVPAKLARAEPGRNSWSFQTASCAKQAQAETPPSCGWTKIRNEGVVG
eukprot:8071175-Pyramimonas_sp.AAC.1